MDWVGQEHESELDDRADQLGALMAEAEWLAKGGGVRFMNDVALRCAS